MNHDPLQIHGGIRREFKADDLPLKELEHPALADFAKTIAKGFAPHLYFLVHIRTQATPGRHRSYWVIITGDPMHEVNTPFADGDINVNVFDMTQVYEKGFLGFTLANSRLNRPSVGLSEFERGRLYQAADEAARTGSTALLGSLTLSMLRSAAEGKRVMSV